MFKLELLPDEIAALQQSCYPEDPEVVLEISPQPQDPAALQLLQTFRYYTSEIARVEDSSCMDYKFWGDLALFFSITKQDLLLWSLQHEPECTFRFVDFFELARLLERWRKFTLRSVEIRDSYLFLEEEGFCMDCLQKPAFDHFDELANLFNDIFRAFTEKYELAIECLPDAPRHKYNEGSRGLEELLSLQRHLGHDQD